MKNGRLKNGLAYILFVLFLSMKMTGLHVLSHTDDKDHALHCTICDHAVAHNLTPALTPDIPDFTIENTELIAREETTNTYGFIVSNTIASDQLFSRPPPFLL